MLDVNSKLWYGEVMRTMLLYYCTRRTLLQLDTGMDSCNTERPAKDEEQRIANQYCLGRTELDMAYRSFHAALPLGTLNPASLIICAKSS